MYQIKQGDCLELMKELDDGCVDLTVTSPPYDNLRTYENSIEWNFKIFTKIAKELFRVTKEGGVVVWVVGDATINGSETGTSFRQALFFKRIGFNLHDTMIYQKNNPMPINGNRYTNCFEYMYVLSKNKPKSVNLMHEKSIHFGKINTGTNYDKNGMLRRKSGHGNPYKEHKVKNNIWGYNNTGNEDCSGMHPAIFLEALANDHILSWSNEGDTVLDPFLGSGTTGKMAIRNNRNFIGFEKVEKYYTMAEKRILEEIDKTSLFNNAMGGENKKSA